MILSRHTDEKIKAGCPAMDNYIVRIYRRDIDDPRRIAGMVEIVDQEEKKAFAGIEELVNILAPVPEKSPCANDRHSRKKRG
jgi:hypothetical protein